MDAAIAIALIFAVLATVVFLDDIFTKIKYRKIMQEVETRWDNLPIRGRTVSRAGGKNGNRKRKRT